MVNRCKIDYYKLESVINLDIYSINPIWWIARAFFITKNAIISFASFLIEEINAVNMQYILPTKLLSIKKRMYQFKIAHNFELFSVIAKAT